MINIYLIIKTIHIISSTLLFGTGLGTAFFMLQAYRSGNAEALRVTSRHVVIADYMFTLPAVIVQLATGLWLTNFLGIAWNSAWFVAVMSLFVAVGLCWIPVVFIQIRIRQIAEGDAHERIDALMKLWTALGIPAFLMTLILFALMVLKIGIA